jgi:hypothetical protein
MICIAHDGAPYGHVTINGKAATLRQLASISGTPEREVSRLLSELEDAGVFSKTQEGTIFSRRMERDHEASKAGRDHVEKRWGNSRDGNKPQRGMPKTTPIRGGDTLESEADTEADTESVSLRSTDRARARGSRLTDDWTPGPDGARYARELGLDPKAVFTVFQNYWQSKAGKDAAKVDWPKVWQNWCIKEAERTGAKPPAARDLLTPGPRESFTPTVSNGL